MNIALCILAGGIAGWLAYAVVGFNAERGLIVSIIIGAFGGFIGGKLLAPALTAAAVGVSMPALFISFGAAAALLYAGSVIHERWGV